MLRPRLKGVGARVFVLVVLSVATREARASSVHVVDDDGAATASSCDDPSEVHTSVGAAMEAASDGDMILVCPGVYVENVDFAGKGVYLRSVAGPDSTILDGGDRASVVTFAAGEGPSSVLEGFTLRNGYAHAQPFEDEGGGVRIHRASPIVRGNVITNNRACSGGAGIAMTNSSGVVEDNWVVENSGTCTTSYGGGLLIEDSIGAVVRRNVIAHNMARAAQGGGIFLNNGRGILIERNTIANNYALRSGHSRGGGIGIVNQADGTAVLGNLITGNDADLGGGIAWFVPSGEGFIIVNNTIADNTASQGSAIFAGWKDADAQIVNNILTAPAGSTPVVCDDFNDLLPPQFRHNNVWSSDGARYGGVCVDATGFDSNISVDPQFVDAVSGDYRMQPGAVSIEAGTNLAPRLPLVDLHGNPRINDGNGDGMAVVDMGAIEHPLPVAVDVRPRMGLNFVRPQSRGWLLVAILSDERFDATNVDRGSIEIGPSRARVVAGAFRDSNGDGRLDAIVVVKIRDMGITCGATTLSLRGDTADGLRFAGSDAIRTFGCR